MGFSRLSHVAAAAAALAAKFGGRGTHQLDGVEAFRRGGSREVGLSPLFPVGFKACLEL
jgi:hypothetical protein